jgi:cytochrome c biogenesis protein CcmG/thiol:disulfide interchange protein DsbE
MLQPNVQFLGVVFQDQEEKILGFLQQRGTAYPTVVDDRGKTAIAYGVGGVPESYFIDANGVIRAKFAGPMSGDIIQANLQKVLRQ